MGRPLITTNTDNTTKVASYSGCGCAGGEVVTLTDEGTIDGGVARRRQQKIYSDAFGRRVKTEVLNWQGGTVYATTVNTFNQRDQLTQVRQYVGAEGNATYQDTTMTYDGYGRLKTKHAPEQQVGSNNPASTDHTTWAYNTDDTIQSVTDARGAVATYSYNSRKLISGISYSLLPGVPTSGFSAITSAALVSFNYDAAGNRTSMTDGLGTVTYSYNVLSRLTSESRTFSGLIGSFNLSYGYNLAGQLTSITDHFGAQVGYQHDTAGRVSAITGSGFANVSNYASNFQYRAWGAAKHVGYGNGISTNMSFNARQQITHFAIPGIMNKDYQYYADGQLSFLDDAMNSKFDRSYSHNHTGQLSLALSGQEANGGGPTGDRPYNQSYGYDPFGHLTTQTGKHWSINFPTTTDTYTNNRQPGVMYDAEGNQLAGYTYDAAGEMRTVSVGLSDGTQRQVDGNGRQVKTVRTETILEDTFTTITYYLRSSLLGGQVISEVAEDGTKRRGFVYAGGNVLASQIPFHNGPNDAVIWEHRDPSNSSFRTTVQSGTLNSNPNPQEAPAELDPTSASVGLTDPNQSPPVNGETFLPYPSFGSPADMQTTFSRDGIPIPRDQAIEMLHTLPGGNLSLLYASQAQSTRVIGRRDYSELYGIRTYVVEGRG